MKVGDLVGFPETGYTALILEQVQAYGDGAQYDHVRLLVTQKVDFKNPTWMSMHELKRCAEVINASR
jgi:hypothetical protein